MVAANSDCPYVNNISGVGKPESLTISVDCGAKLTEPAIAPTFNFSISCQSTRMVLAGRNCHWFVTIVNESWKPTCINRSELNRFGPTPYLTNSIVPPAIDVSTATACYCTSVRKADRDWDNICGEPKHINWSFARTYAVAVTKLTFTIEPPALCATATRNCTSVCTARWNRSYTVWQTHDINGQKSIRLRVVS